MSSGDFAKVARLIKKAGLSNLRPVNAEGNYPDDDLLPLQSRIGKILELYNRSSLKPGHMLYFVMYDIENDKVRRYLSKYLERKGCVRIQKSIFLAETSHKVYKEIGDNLREVQEAYNNHDSIYLVPVSSEQIRAVRIIGQGFDGELFTNPPGTLII